MKKRNISKASIVFYLFAVLFLVAFIISFYNVNTYISSLIEAGSVTWADSWLSIILYYISNTGNCLGFTVGFVGLGYMIQLLKGKVTMKVEDVKEESLS